MTETFDVFDNSEEKNNKIVSWFQRKFGTTKKTDDEIVDILKKAQEELDIAMNNYEFAEEPELIDYYTYNIKAAQMRYEYLLRKVKDKGM